MIALSPLLLPLVLLHSLPHIVSELLPRKEHQQGWRVRAWSNFPRVSLTSWGPFQEARIIFWVTHSCVIYLRHIEYLLTTGFNESSNILNSFFILFCLMFKQSLGQNLTLVFRGCESLDLVPCDNVGNSWRTGPVYNLVCFRPGYL